MMGPPQLLNATCHLPLSMCKPSSVPLQQVQAIAHYYTLLRITSFQQELGKWHELFRVSYKHLSKQNREPLAPAMSNVSQTGKVLLHWFAQTRKRL